MNYCHCEICDEKDCKVCLEPQYCECNCGTCQDAKSALLPDEDETNETIEKQQLDELMNDIEKDGR